MKRMERFYGQWLKERANRHNDVIIQAIGDKLPTRPMPEAVAKPNKKQRADGGKLAAGMALEYFLRLFPSAKIGLESETG